MPTQIVVRRPNEQQENRVVSETVEDVVMAVNNGLGEPDRWITLTDADSGKAFAVRAGWVRAIHQD